MYLCDGWVRKQHTFPGACALDLPLRMSIMSIRRGRLSLSPTVFFTPFPCSYPKAPANSCINDLQKILKWEMTRKRMSSLLAFYKFY
jgi:hypothetical protein